MKIKNLRNKNWCAEEVETPDLAWIAALFIFIRGQLCSWGQT